jgi:hypothetical protein
VGFLDAVHVDFVAFYLAFQDDRRATVDDPLELLNYDPGIVLVDVEFWAICNPVRFNPMRYK